MKYYKQLDENGKLIRVDKGIVNSCNGLEIIQKEYNDIINGIKPKMVVGANSELYSYEE